MYNVLFDKPKEISENEVFEKVNSILLKRNEAWDLFHNETNRKSDARKLAQLLRKELEAEYKNNNKDSTEQFYFNHPLFNLYSNWIRDSYANTSGNLDNGTNTKNFLYDIDDYATYYFPKL